jgi:flagellar basal body-associated protein FliL
MKKLFQGKRKFLMAGVFVVVLAGGYMFSHGHAKQVLKVKGTIYELPKSFLIDLAGGQYAKLNVALLLSPKQVLPEAATPAASSSSSGGEEKGTLPEEPLVRALITNTLTGAKAETLLEERPREQLAEELLKEINERTDLRVEAVLFPDLTVQ